MATKNSIDSNIPIEISKGGTNANSMSTSTGIVKYDGTSLITSSTAKIDSSNIYTNSSQPAFLAYLATSKIDKTGAGASYTLGTDNLTEVFDQGSNFNVNGTFTAPVTGKYHFDSKVNIAGLTTEMTNIVFNLVTSNRTYSGTKLGIGTVKDAGGLASAEIHVLADMDDGDTATISIAVANGAGNTADISGSATVTTYISGFLAC